MGERHPQWGQAAASLILANAGGSMSNYDGQDCDHRIKGGIFTNGTISLPMD
jgi:3'-phosphoadenosine 5'-phosphosulfate (PAPS) 3'-phosphatase